MSCSSLTMLFGCRHATGKAQHGNFLVAIKQEKGESARVGGEKPEEEVSPGARVPSHTIPGTGAQGARPGAGPAPAQVSVAVTMGQGRAQTLPWGLLPCATDAMALVPDGLSLALGASR